MTLETSSLIRQKTRAAGLHLAASAAVISGLFALIFLLWYPDPYFGIKGADHIIVVLIGVDLVLGPLLTFIVFRRGKRGMKFDLGAIVTLQLIALLYGASAIYEERPYFMIFSVDRFSVLAEKDVDFDLITNPAFRDKPWRGPLRLVAEMPVDVELQQRLLKETLFEHKADLERRPQYWVDYATNLDHLLAASHRVTRLRDARPGQAGEIDRLLSRLKRSADELYFVPVIGKNGDFAVFVEPGDGAILGAIETDPWVR